MSIIRDYGRIIIDIVPYLFPVIDLTIWLFTGDSHALAGIFGNLLNIGINLFLRWFIGKFFTTYAAIYAPTARETACQLKTPEWLKKCGGVVDMPSIHAQQVGYYSLFWLLVLAFEMGYDFATVRKAVALILLLLFGYTVMYARFLLEYSTLAQLIVGYLIGCLIGASYYFMCFAIVKASSGNDW